MLQQSAEWFEARVGKFTASRAYDATARTKKGWAACRDDYLTELVTERFTGEVYPRFETPAMRWGNEQEAFAKAAYAWKARANIEEVGFVEHPTIFMSGASPDGLVGDDGLVEVKCPNSGTHMETLLTEEIDERYQVQMLWQMACTGRAWCDFVSYDPRMPPHLRLFVKRFPRDDARIAELETMAVDFLGEVAATVELLRKKYEPPPEPEPDPEPEPEPERKKRDWSDLSPASQVVLACKEAAFREFLSSRLEPDCPNLDEEAAQETVKWFCGVARKRDIAGSPTALAKWGEIYGTFTAWRDYERAA